MSVTSVDKIQETHVDESAETLVSAFKGEMSIISPACSEGVGGHEFESGGDFDSRDDQSVLTVNLNMITIFYVLKACNLATVDNLRHMEGK